ncbi:MAG: hypothetical protein ACJA04_000363 [Cellvibrionaceae bacterium]|jgi:uncharacterized protein (DUF983 family)
MKFKVNNKCPHCDKEAVSKLRKLSFLGLVITCKYCEAELGVKTFSSPILLITILLGLPLIKIYAWLTPLNILGWLVILVGSELHMAKVPFFVRNFGRKNASKNS